MNDYSFNMDKKQEYDRRAEVGARRGEGREKSTGAGGQTAQSQVTSIFA
jgi:hypothetical protein